MATKPNDVIGGLAELSFRALPPVPCSDASYDFGHDQAERRYPYIDGAGHDHTGRQPIRITATLYFVNTLEKGLYPAAWNEWREGLLDGSSGKLDHPDLGLLRARVVSGSVKLVATNRAGVVVSVQWVETNDKVDQPADFTGPSVSVVEAAKAADKALAVLKIPYPRIVDPPQVNLLDAILAIQGQLFSLGLRALGMINQVIGTVRKLIDVVTGANLPKAWPALYNLQLVESALHDMAASAQQDGRQTGQITTGAGTTTLDAIARSVNNTVVDLANLNPALLGRPSIGPGVRVTYYKPS